MAGDAMNGPDRWGRPRGPDPILRSLAPEDRRAYLLGLVRVETAILLGRPEPEAVPADVTFADLGITCTEAIELHDRLADICGTELPRDLVREHPCPDTVAALLHGELFGDPLEELLLTIDRLERAVAQLGADERDMIVGRLRGLLGRFGADPHSINEGR
jgi:hypothetical protein